EDLTREVMQVQAFRDTWELGVHSYLTYLRDRLLLCRELLKDEGSIFLQIGDENVHRVRCLMDEVFGEENFCGQIPFKKTTATGAELLDAIADHLLWFSKDKKQVKFRALLLDKEAGGAGGEAYRMQQLPDGQRRPIGKADGELSGARPFRPSPLTSDRPAQGNDLREYVFQGTRYTPGRGTFKTDQVGLRRLECSDRLIEGGSRLQYVRFIDDFPAYPLSNLWTDTQSGSGMDKQYAVQTNPKVIERCILMTTDPGDLVLDPTCGSGTTAYVAEQWGRRWITMDTSRVALAIARHRPSPTSPSNPSPKTPRSTRSRTSVDPEWTLRSRASTARTDQPTKSRGKSGKSPG
ncbi:MAG: site-specific DNA-methyltransferase, partial [Armatimonadetes bacterium]